LALVGLLLIVPAALALDVQDILRLKQAGVTEETILRVVDDARAVVRLSVDDILDLKDAGCSDEPIRALLDTAERFGPGADEARDPGEYQYGDGEAYRSGNYDPNAYDYSIYDDDYETVFGYQYYDPFAYNWYPWPDAYLYWSPFWWGYAGFYYGGSWCNDWWDPWGPCSYYCDDHWGYEHHCGQSETRVTARRTYDHPDHPGEPDGRARGAATQRMSREDQVYRRAGQALAPEARVRPTASVTRQAPAARSAAGTRSLRTLDGAVHSRNATVPRATSQGVTRAPYDRSSAGRAAYRRPETGTNRAPANAPRRGEVGRSRTLPRTLTSPSRSSAAPSGRSRSASVAPHTSGRSSAPHSSGRSGGSYSSGRSGGSSPASHGGGGGSRSRTRI